MPEGPREVLTRVLRTYKRIRPTLFGDRYVLAGPVPQRAPENLETGSWEAYENLSLDGSLVAVFRTAA